jgi:hypothetical protein
MTLRSPFRLVAVLTVFAAVLAGAMPASATSNWYSGMRAFGQVTVEPAVDYSTGNQIFLLTPNNVPTPSHAAQRAHAPLYLPLYPDISTIPASSLNCQRTNCNHAQIPGIKGHDHLVGMASTHGDFNVAWDVILVIFTDQGIADGAINHRILTLTALNAVVANHDAFETPFETPGGPFSFNCSITSETTYVKGTPLTFP